ncbi:MAG: DUF835 domain-containing protein [Methanomassiliicoccus sp.]|nr:DUF835 domain-containing protein [Methanomassiliicoccus sp.]
MRVPVLKMARSLAGDLFTEGYRRNKIFIREAAIVGRDALSTREEFYRGYVKGFEEGLNKAWDELIGLTTKGFSPREIQVMAKSKRQSINESVRDVKTEIRAETGIDLLSKAPARGPRVEVERGNTYLIESMYATKALTVVNELTADGTQALCILRSFPGNYQGGLNDTVTAYWLTKHESSQYGPYTVISPTDMPRLISETRNFMRAEEGRVVLVEGVEYLIMQSADREVSVLKFISLMSDLAITLRGVLLLSVYPPALDEKVINNLKCLASGTL